MSHGQPCPYLLPAVTLHPPTYFSTHVTSCLSIVLTGMLMQVTLASERNFGPVCIDTTGGRNGGGVGSSRSHLRSDIFPWHQRIEWVLSSSKYLSDWLNNFLILLIQLSILLKLQLKCIYYIIINRQSQLQFLPLVFNITTCFGWLGHLQAVQNSENLGG
jgi:hypothetical protein